MKTLIFINFLKKCLGPLPVLALLEVVGSVPKVLAPKFVDKLPIFKVHILIIPTYCTGF